VVTQPDGTRRDPFAEYHAGKTRQYIDKTMVSGQDIFPVMQACTLLAWYFYQEGRWVEVWIFAGFQTRVAVPLRLNYPGTFSTHGNSSPGAYLAPPKNLNDLESRRRTWWMTIIFDRIASVGGWIHAVDERDIGTEFPLRNDDFDSEVGEQYPLICLHFTKGLSAAAYSQQSSRPQHEGCLCQPSSSLHRLLLAVDKGRHALRKSD
jgi:hypothetical protein